MGCCCFEKGSFPACGFAPRAHDPSAWITLSVLITRRETASEEKVLSDSQPSTYFTAAGKRGSFFNEYNTIFVAILVASSET
jgi:hypothetical protein